MTTPYTHPTLGFTLELPPGSQALADTAGAALVAAEPPTADRVLQANLVVTAEETGGGSLQDFTDASLAAQAQALQAHRLIDRATVTLMGAEATRTLAHHDFAGEALTIEQWRWVDGERGYTLTASCWTLDYDAVCDAFAASARTFQP